MSEPVKLPISLTDFVKSRLVDKAIEHQPCFIADLKVCYPTLLWIKGKHGGLFVSRRYRELMEEKNLN